LNYHDCTHLGARLQDSKKWRIRSEILHEARTPQCCSFGEMGANKICPAAKGEKKRSLSCLQRKTRHSVRNFPRNEAMDLELRNPFPSL
jgi:hypothetical protein